MTDQEYEAYYVRQERKEALLVGSVVLAVFAAIGALLWWDKLLGLIVVVALALYWCYWAMRQPTI